MSHYTLCKASISSIILSIFLFNSASTFAQTKEIAITLDDLPFVGASMNTPGNIQRANERFHRLLQVFVDHQVPVTGFVIAGAIAKDQWPWLEEFRAAGLSLGNHTYSHRNLDALSAQQYISDIDKADKILDPILTSPKYFRYPYLAESRGMRKKQVLDYLGEHQYQIAPVTIDSKDFKFNAQLLAVHWTKREQALPRFKERYLSYIWNQTLLAEKRAGDVPTKQILLIHANLLNSYLLGDVIEMYKKNGYRFITLTEALQDPQNEARPQAAAANKNEAMQESALRFSFGHRVRFF